MYSVEKQGDRFHVMKDGKSLASFESEDDAKSRADTLQREADAESGKTMPNSLADSCFLYIQSGGVLDDEQKTVPRTLRHFRIRDAAGVLDAQALADALVAIPEAKSIGLDDDERSRMATRVRRMVDQLERGEKTVEDAPEWKTGAAVDLLTVAYGLQATAEEIVAEQAHRTALGEGTKNGWKLKPESFEAIKTLSGHLARLVEHAELVATGKDEEALADWWRAQFDLLEVAS